MKPPAEVKEQILRKLIAHPVWGQVHMADQLRLEGISVSPSTVRNLWLKEGLETRYKRLLRLEEETDGQDIELTAEQIRLLENAGFIKIDFNPWIMAPRDSIPILHTIDEFRPESHVYALFDTSDVKVELSWIRRDDSLGLGSGVASYSIYVSRDGGPCELWPVDTEDTVAVFTAEYGQTYYFYSVARDSVGNVEEPPSVPDAWIIIISYICGDANADGNINLLHVTFLINYLYKNGPAPEREISGDSDGSGNINLLDVTYLINYLYKNGPEPVC